jgi:replicative DNA helicase
MGNLGGTTMAMEEGNKEFNEEDIVEEKVMEDFHQTTLDDIDEFEAESLKKGSGYKLPRFPEMEKKLEGLEAGMYLFAAESNVGKSAVMTNVQYDMCTCPENNLFGIYFSLDDSKFEIMPRIIAMDQLIPISVASKPQRYMTAIENGEENSALYADWLEKRKEGLIKLRELNKMFKITDSSKIKTAEDMYEYMLRAKIFIKSIDANSNISVSIDSVNDIKFGEKYFNNSVDKHSEIARTIKDWTTDLRVPIFGACHLRKINANRRPTLDDLKESIEYVYESSVVWLLYNDVSKNKQSANIYYNAEGIEGKSPIIEMDWAKNKKSSFKGNTYNYFSPQYSRIAECDKELMKRYDSLIYEG